MYDELVRCLRGHSQKMGCADNCICEDADKRGFGTCSEELAKLAADAIEELNRRISRAVELYNRNVEKSAMYEALMGISPEPPKEEKKDLAGRYACDDVPKLLAIPAADVKPVVRGEWERTLWFVTCSVCEYTSADTDDEGSDIALNFCPNCGADMRGERDG